MEASGAEAAVQRLEERLKATHGGVEEQTPFHKPSHIPTGVPKTCYDEASRYNRRWRLINEICARWGVSPRAGDLLPPVPVVRQLPCVQRLVRTPWLPGAADLGP